MSEKHRLKKFMSEKSKEVKDARRLVRTAESDLIRARVELADLVCKFVNEFPEDLHEDTVAADEFPVKRVVVGQWECQNSPIGVCVYNGTDSAMDYCLYCGGPDERK